MKILYVTSEAGPFAASGGLGDVMGALPAAVAAVEGNECEVIMPLYDTVKEEYRCKMELVIDLTFNHAWRHTGASVFKLTHNNVTYYFVENHYYFNRGRLYGEFDDAERFAFFSRAVIEFMLQSGRIPNILHANDWQTASAIIYLKTQYAGVDALKNVKTVYTIHNIEYQGKFGSHILGDVFGLDYAHHGVVDFDGCINLMKGALVTSDYITTVSPNYAKELEHDYFAFGLSSIIRDCRHKMKGVINGIDYGYFSPDKGGDIYASYNNRTYKSGKAKNKAGLQAEVGLPVEPNVPLMVMITRFASQKGIDLVLHIIDELLSENVQMIVLGTGEKEYEDAFRAAEQRHPNNFRALIKFDRVISKKMYAGADIFLMPSKSEPCGLAQMISCSYGTIPVVRSVGGLYDSIRSYGEEGANGFRFNNYNAHELLFTVKDALELYKTPKKWNELTASAKKSNFTWENSAKEYISIYNNLV